MSFRMFFRFGLLSLFSLHAIFSGAAAEEAEVAVDTITIYEGMSYGSTVVKALPQGTHVFVAYSTLGIEGEWCSIKESAKWIIGISLRPLLVTERRVIAATAAATPAKLSCKTFAPPGYCFSK